MTTIIVNTSPLLKGRSCSDVPLKLYLATHSVPCGHGTCGKMDRSQISRKNIKSSLTRHALTCDLWVLHERLLCRSFTDLDICHGGVFQSSHRSRFLTEIIRAGKHAPAGDVKRDWISIFASAQTGRLWMCSIAAQKTCKFQVNSISYYQFERCQLRQHQ